MKEAKSCYYDDCPGGYRTLYIPVLIMPYVNGKKDKYEIQCDDRLVCAVCALRINPMNAVSISDWELLVNKLLQDGLDVPDRSRAKLRFIPVKN